MRTVFYTNLDNYKTSCFYELQDTPRMGDFVAVSDVYQRFFMDKKLPTRLEVISVTWMEDKAVCELWYNKTDLELMKQLNINPF